ncbi:hypothetical protein DCC62_11405 [candidate division KSB1 bacterium]|nr:MAG: hypothetical protein DCC62_11405 [candidate division KSB1 bacterium]
MSLPQKWADDNKFMPEAQCRVERRSPQFLIEFAGMALSKSWKLLNQMLVFYKNKSYFLARNERACKPR